MTSRTRIRAVAAADRDLLFLWRNDPDIVSKSGSKRPVTQAEHAAWFQRLASSGSSFAYIVEADGLPVGHLRFDRQSDGAFLVTIYLRSEARGTGSGTEALLLGCSEVARVAPESTIIADVLVSNAPARAFFEKAGFSALAPDASGDQIRLEKRAFSIVSERERQATRSKFELLLSEHGDSHKSLDWGSAAGQMKRFELLARIGDLSGRSVLDVGCGLGHFLDWARPRFPGIRYKGVDIAPAMIASARVRHSEDEFEVADAANLDQLPPLSFDYVISSGLFFTYPQGGIDLQMRMIDRMWRIAKIGLSFNSLSTWAEKKDAGEYYADPIRLLESCRSLSPALALFHDYHPRDFTIHIKRAIAL